MNIFYIDADPKIAAQSLCDNHIRKMQIESAQMLCTTFWHYGFDAPYKKAHYNHPSTKWTRESKANFDWLLTHGYEVCIEFEKRYGKKHKTEDVINWISTNRSLIVDKFPNSEFTPPPQAMPDDVKNSDTIQAYRDYYCIHKNKIAFWNKLPNRKPSWYTFK